MSRVSRSRPRLHNFSESDISINSANDDQDQFENSAATSNHVIDADEGEDGYQHGGKEQQRMPLKSTLLTDQGPGGSGRRKMRQSRNPIPDTLWDNDRMLKSQNNNLMSLDRKSMARMDATLSTQRSDSILDDMRHDEMMNRKDASMIDGVGQGHYRRTGGGKAAEEIRLGLNQHQFVHPSPGPAARYGQLRQSAMPSILRNHDIHPESADDSDSAIESSSNSSEATDVPDVFHRAKRSIGNSTGNHQGFMRSPQLSKNADAAPRPKLPYRWKDKLGELHGPSDAIAADSRKHDIGTFPSTVRPPRSDSASNESGFAAGSNRKVSSGSSKGKEAEASTSGATLVNEQNYFANASHFRLPSGQRMGKGVPSSGFSLPADLTGMSMALESPVKTRQGVEHRPIVPETVQAFAATTVQERERGFNGLKSYIKYIEDKVDKVEDSFANELGSLKSEWKVWKETQHDVKAERDLQHHNGEAHHALLEQDNVDGDATIHYRSSLANVRKMASDIGDSMEDHRATLAKLRKKEQDLLARESLRSKRAAQIDRHDEDKDDVDLDSLRSQVEAASREVNRLKIIIDRQGRAKEVLSASSPIKPSSRSRPTKIGGGNPFVQQRKISEELKKQNAPAAPSEYDDGFGQAPKQRSSSGHGSDRHIEEDFVVDEVDEQPADLHRSRLDEVEDVSMIAEKRAERASEKVIDARSIAHDAESCTCCARQDENKRRKDARKMKALSQWKKEDPKTTRSRSYSAATYVNPQEDDLSAQALLEEIMVDLENHAEFRLPPALIQLANKQRSLLEWTIKAEMDEFYHAKRNYCDLADELKSFSPDISAARRRILADHVLIAVENLELRANRVDRLRAALAAALPAGVLDGQNDQFDESLQKRTRKHHTRPRNSPPIVDKALHSHHTDAFRHLDV
ncbi:uncharacterized protein FA14DRAFT_34703 [Meira miltonrushii]|uniref:Cep57 centrosome microtubule-binding domain-containing protein n=1 Tax=Meira miltonrushii TaxID=1280837 RepID=A0A316VEU5_9BASI|nr:uncharacterized protein FA14DRAFT_34703 [Meira miltonrushii]PWN34833.1 hypothetical protein FA14DRAFT_34703 [Meira miltonrushii]